MLCWFLFGGVFGANMRIAMESCLVSLNRLFNRLVKPEVGLFKGKGKPKLPETNSSPLENPRLGSMNFPKLGPVFRGLFSEANC